ncbi:hypothetical protein [Kribbella sp. NPDC048928]|uniref:hypothetical protein n=1 Tax=Kribbella sp. NPDC048928 TaxID=3364111 RepID=UPI00371AF892
MDAEEDQQADQHDADHAAADDQRHLLLADATWPLGTVARTARLPLARLTTLLLVPTALLLLAPRLLLVGTAALLLRLLAPTATRLPMLTRLALLVGLLSPAALLRPVLLRRLPVLGLALLRLAVLLRLLRLLWLLRMLWGLSPSTTLSRWLLSPTALLRRLVLRRLLAALSPVPAWLAPRLPRTPWSLRRRRHMSLLLAQISTCKTNSRTAQPRCRIRSLRKTSKNLERPTPPAKSQPMECLPR